MAAYAKIKASTQDHLDIEDITEDLIILKTGWVALVLTTTAINFDILSEAEQDATIYAYGALLNSLSFPMEILIRSKKADITSYFQSLTEAERNQVNPDLKRQIQKYQDFIQSTVQQKTVLDKKFYLIITFSPLELGLKAVGTRRPTKAKSKAALIADAKIALTPKRDHLIKQLARLGLLARQLTTQELIELFYDIYNPAPLGTQRVILDSQSYTAPLVEPAVEIPVPAPSGLVADAEPSLTRSETLRAGGLSSSSIQQPLPPKAQEPSTPIVENLRPVPPAFTDSNSTASGKSTPITSDQRSEISSVLTNQQSNIPPSQSAALKNLQEATAKAAGFINQSKITPTDVQPRPADGQIPSTTPTDNQGGTV
ncbi:hypothetical protein A2W70_01445 [Candidatus Curtissbacteria bacterium RIFCSPLOWO2_02_41_11]|uniref:Uncharacterized protein n=1 Tax=Candidatus Curtissbacteria bacterium RIFCSPLOWO2_02_41_11 TaxID=1797731 RepID=A0A1F5HRM9_9BACT|nr:MAG: hypothetical protein A2W70_01445 [Candidatus Curtissbacteria bacterium RIFCSPLOWO2_02_41_11]